MRYTVPVLALACALTFAADNAAVAPQSTANLQSTVIGHRSAVIGGAEAITIPQLLSYQGRLTDTLGMPVGDTVYAIRFRLYAVPSGGTEFWEETQDVRTRGGLFSVLLGAVTPIGSVPDGGELYLGMAVESGAELVPRLQIGSAAYAYLSERAADADLLQGKDTTGFVRTGQASSVTSSMVVNGTIAAADLGQMGAATGQVMKWSGSAWQPANDSIGQSGGGTVRKVVQATGIVCSPNPIADSGTVRLDTSLTDGRYIRNQFVSSQAASWRIQGQGRCSTATSGPATLHCINTTGWAIRGDGAGTYYGGVIGACSAPNSWGVQGINSTTSSEGAGVLGVSSWANGVVGWSDNSIGVIGFSDGLCGVSGSSYSGDGVCGYSGAGYGAYDSSYSSYGAYCAGGGGGVYGKSAAGKGVSGVSVSDYGVYGISDSNYGVRGNSSYSDGVHGSTIASGYSGVSGSSSVSGSGQGIGIYGESPTYWGGRFFRPGSQQGSGYAQDGVRGGMWGYIYWGDTFTFGTAGYTYGDYGRTGGVIGGRSDASTWGSLGYKNSSGNWYGGYGTSGWTSGSGLGSHAATGIGCGYGGGLMGGWLKGTYYGATVSGDRYALYTKGNNYTTGYSAVMQNTGGKREATYVPTSATVDIYTSGVSEMKGGQAAVSFPASFASIVSNDVPVVVTATPMGPAPIYLSASDNKGFTVAAVDAKMTGSVKFSWIAVGRRAGYEKNPEVPAELCRTDFDSKMDGVMFNENDLKRSAQPVWFDGTQLRFDNPPEEPRPPKPAQPVEARLYAPQREPAAVAPVHLRAPVVPRPLRPNTAGMTNAVVPVSPDVPQGGKK